MDKLLKHQETKSSYINNFIGNTKKRIKADNVTAGFYKARILVLNRYWDEFCQSHDALVNIAVEDDASKNYFKDEVFSQTEDSYMLALATLQDSLDHIESQMAGNSIHNSTVITHDNDVRQASVVLPKISIPKFTGDCIEWPSFKDLFDSLIIKNRSLTDVQRLHYLKASLGNDAEHLLRTFTVTEANFRVAWQTLKDNYENQRLIVNMHLRDITSQPSVPRESAFEIKRLITTISASLKALTNLGRPTQHWDDFLVFTTVQKLDNSTRKDWEDSISDNTDLPTFAALEKFLIGRARTLEALDTTKIKTLPQDSKGPVTRIKSHQTTTSSTESSLSRPRCPLCPTSGSHSLASCFKFYRKNTSARQEIVKSSSLCYNCLSGDHATKDCNSTYSCKKCNLRHHTLLHRDNNSSAIRSTHLSAVSQSSSSSSSPSSASNTTVNNHHIDSSSLSSNATVNNVSIGSNLANKSHQSNTVLLATAWIIVWAPNGMQLRLRTLLDQGSQASFISESAVQLLKLTKQKTNVTIVGISATNAATSKSKVIFEFTSCYNFKETFETTALVLDKLTTYVPKCCKSNDQWHHLLDLQLADPSYYESSKIDVVFGADAYANLIREGIRRGCSGSPLAQNTALGWILSGQTQNVTGAFDDDLMISIPSYHIMLNDDIDKSLRRFWELEEIQQNGPHLADDEIECEKHYQETHGRNQDGRYVVRLPIKSTESITKLGSSKAAAMSRLLSMERKFRRDPVFHQSYEEFMTSYQTLGHMHSVPPIVDDQISYYLPHHGVFKDGSSTTKLRVVFDASQKSDTNISLNDILLTGPKLQRDLFSIILRWRTHAIVFATDIEKMFRQILVDQRDVGLQKIIWRSPKDNRFQEFHLQTVTYGMNCAPYLAIRTLLQLSADEKHRFPLASEILSRDCYVDDVLSGAENIESCLELQHQLLLLLQSGGFLLKKWSSNNSQLLNHLPAGYTHNTSPLNIMTELDGIKTLGILWHPGIDKFAFNISLESTDQQPTKRNILSDISKLFDPLGWISPVIIAAKIIMQKLWLNSMGWDECLTGELCNDWLSFRRNLCLLNDIAIERWIGTTNDTMIELHGFSDASTSAYAAAVYVRVLRSDGTFSVNLLAAKTKVAPVKQVTTARLELCGAVLLKRLLDKVRVCFGTREFPIYAWTDSTVVLSWLQGHPNRWQTFIANRVSEILQSMSASQWHHVRTHNNPADCASRGISASQLIDHPLWWHGPEFLLNDSCDWDHSDLSQFSTNLEEKTVHHHSLNVNAVENCDLLQSYSAIDKLLRVTSYVLRFIKNCRNSSSRITGRLKLNEQQAAMIFWIKFTQSSQFSQEIIALQKSVSISSKSKIIKLSPILDQSGVLRVGGRLCNSGLAFSEKHPIILPKKSILSKLIITKAHIITLHGGPQLTLSHILQRYWILGARTEVKNHIHRCIKCFKFKPRMTNQLMGDLPVARVTPNRPFLHSGIDYAGPIQVRKHKGRGNTSFKSYVAVFVCFATKATHLELVSDQTAQGFIAAFKRFVARRGIVSNLYSDCGSNFIGADGDLQFALKTATRQQAEDIVDFLTSSGTEWHFNPPGAPHFSGLCEAAVKSMKSHLRKVIGKATLTFEEMVTLLTQIEACLNSRPISPLTDDPEDLHPLTPGHFLVGQPLCTVPEPNLLDINTGRLTRWRMVQQMYQHFWKRWATEYLNILQQRTKWNSRLQNIKIGDLVLMKDDRYPPCMWPLGRIISIHPGHDGIVRVVGIRAKSGIFQRPIVKVCVLPINDTLISDQQLGSKG